jgi:predicted transcriptional regulator
MVSKRSLPRPTDAELVILRVLWEHAPMSVRQIQRTLDAQRPGTGYTTVLKLIQIMTQKGLVERDESVRPQLYRPRLRREETQKRLVKDLVERAFAGSAKELVMQLLSTRPASQEELAAIERLLNKVEARGR